MVDVTDKSKTVRMAKSKGIISMSPETISAIKGDTIPKGNVLTTAKISGIQSAKRTADLIPMCHQLNLTFVDIQFKVETNYILIKSTIKTMEATGVEMEALTAVSVAALTIFDMCKAIDKTMSIGEINLVEKVGGKSSHVAEYRPQVWYYHN
jgi:molybdenum cofactor biosynthesis protein MoaC